MGRGGCRSWFFFGEGAYYLLHFSSIIKHLADQLDRKVLFSFIYYVQFFGLYRQAIAMSLHPMRCKGSYECGALLLRSIDLLVRLQRRKHVLCKSVNRAAHHCVRRGKIYNIVIQILHESLTEAASLLSGTPHFIILQCICCCHFVLLLIVQDLYQDPACFHVANAIVASNRGFEKESF